MNLSVATRSDLQS